MWGDRVLIIMDAAQTVAVCRAAPNSTVIATHMEALDHATVTRAALRKYAETQGIGPGKLLIPFDGEKIAFSERGSARTLPGQHVLKQQPDRGHERQGQRELLEQLLVDVAQQRFAQQRAGHGKGHEPQADRQ